MSVLVTNAVDGLSTSKRTVTYAPPPHLTGDAVTLPYTRLRPRIRQEYIGRQELYRVCRFDFTFLVSADSGALLRERLNRIHRSLMKSRGVLEVREDGALLFTARPATLTDAEVPITVLNQDDVTVENYKDIDQGPRPLSWNVDDFMGLAAVIEWSIEVRAVTEDLAEAITDPFVEADPNVLALDVRASYLVDQVGLNIRRIAGRLFVRNAHPLANNWWTRGSDHADKLRRILVADRFSPYIVGNLQCPIGFVREQSEFDIDETENVLTFSFLDREVRATGLAPDVLRGDVSVAVRTEGWFGLQPVYRSYFADFEGDVHSPMGNLLLRALQIFSILIDFDKFPLTFVPRFEFNIPNYYTRNRITVAIETVTPFAITITEWDKFLGINRPNMPLAAGFPTMVGGTGTATGSGYSPQAGKDGVIAQPPPTVANIGAAVLEGYAVDPETARPSDALAATNVVADVFIKPYKAIQGSSLLPRRDIAQTGISFRKTSVEYATPRMYLRIHLAGMIHYTTSADRRAVVQDLLARTLGTAPQWRKLGTTIYHSGPFINHARGAFGSVRQATIRADVVIEFNGNAMERADLNFTTGVTGGGRDGLENFARWVETLPDVGDPSKPSVVAAIISALGL